MLLIRAAFCALPRFLKNSGQLLSSNYIAIRPAMTERHSRDIKLNKSDEVIEGLAASFRDKGFGVIENFLSEQEVQELRDESTRLIREESTKEGQRQIFGNEYNARSDYFVTSGDKIRFFFEKNAFNLDTGELLVDEDQSLAKIGHALHCLNPVFRRITTSEKVKSVYRALGFEDPTVAQSMVIFKNPKVGGEYTPHQDASFLCTEPIHLAGAWLALDDATPENGCLQFIPGSHTWPLHRRFTRNKDRVDDQLLQWSAPVKEYSNDQFVEVPVKRGSLVMIHGLVVHRSAPNKSDKARWIYTFHAYDRARARYLDDNWLQATDNDTFMSIYKN